MRSFTGNRTRGMEPSSRRFHSSGEQTFGCRDQSFSLKLWYTPTATSSFSEWSVPFLIKRIHQLGMVVKKFRSSSLCSSKIIPGLFIVYSDPSGEGYSSFTSPSVSTSIMIFAPIWKPRMKVSQSVMTMSSCCASWQSLNKVFYSLGETDSSYRWGFNIAIEKGSDASDPLKYAPQRHTAIHVYTILWTWRNCKIFLLSDEFS